MKTVLWIHDQYHAVGGAFLSDNYWQYQLAAALGVNFLSIAQPSLEEVRQLADQGGADLVIVSNHDHLSVELLRWLKHRPFVKIHHGTLAPERVRGLWSNALLNIGMSPSHAERLKEYGVATDYAAPYVPTSFDKVDRIDPEGYFYIGALLEHKGIVEILGWARERGIVMDFYGEGEKENQIKSEGHRVHPYVDPNLVENIYTQHESFVWFLPRYGSYGRTLVEAHLAGCEVIANRDAFGLYSYSWDFGNPKNIRENLDKELAKFVKIIQSYL